LKLGTADAVFHSQVLNRLKEERNSIDFGEFRLQTPDYFGCVNLSILQRFQVDLNAPAVQRGVRAVNSNKRRKTLDCRIFQNDIVEGLLALGHSLKRNILRALRDAEDFARILYREKALRNVNVEQDRRHQRSNSDQQRCSLKSQHDFQG